VTFRIAFVPGVTPGKWLRTWQERSPEPIEATMVDEGDQLAVLRDNRADMCFVRLPVERDGLHVIPLYHEVPVVVVSKEHPVAAYDEIPVVDLANEYLLQDPDEVPAWRDVSPAVRDGSRVDVPSMTMKQAVETVAAGTGIVIVPMSVARLHHRKDVTYRPVTGVAESQVGLAWPAGTDDERVEQFIGIVRGRTARSSRGQGDDHDHEDRPRAGKSAPPRAGARKQPKASGAKGSTPRSSGRRQGSHTKRSGGRGRRR
jgi:DNA-binding transcriptional LysR family regulator